MASFQDNLCKLVPDCQTILDFAAARNDGGGDSDNQNLYDVESSRQITTNMPTLSF